MSVSELVRFTTRFGVFAMLASCGAKSALIVPPRDAIDDVTNECGVSGPPTPEAFVWSECETGGGQICGTWTWDPSQRVFSARWENGAIATLTLTELDDCGIVVERNDFAGSSRGLTARYVGQRQGRAVVGSVTWRGGAGNVEHGTWRASW